MDAGGVEECIPTIRGVPDHGDAWSRPWAMLSPETAVVETDSFRLARSVNPDASMTSNQRINMSTQVKPSSALVLTYRLEAQPGWRFLWAAHALLDVSENAVLQARPGTETRIDGAPNATWPTPLAKLGPDDGTATGAILLDCPTATVVDGQRLTFFLEAPGQPVSIALWRNLRGWPADNPYRSIGVEPMLGRVWDLAEAGPVDAAVVPQSGLCEWRLTVTAA